MPRLHKGWRVVIWIGVVVGGLLLALNVSHWLLIDHDGQPVCHKLVYLANGNYSADQKNSEEFPNINGRSSDSLAQLRDLMDSDVLETNYSYVPGLRKGDPGGLVLMYFRQPTRWIWHGQARTLLAPKGWIVVPVDFKDRDSPEKAGPGEMSEWVSTAEFKKRLKDALEFVRINERPNWQTMVKEHSEFLKSVKD